MLKDFPLYLNILIFYFILFYVFFFCLKETANNFTNETIYAIDLWL